MSDLRTPPSGQPSPEELRAYLEQLRTADAAGLVAEAYNLLAAGAQVKLGRDDARTLIDAMGALVGATQARIPTELATQMRQGVGQLQMAQVEAERDLAGQGAGQEGEPDGNAGGDPAGQPDGGGDAGPAQFPRPPGPGPSQPPGRPSTQPGQAGGGQMTDRLWIPGRDPGPPRRR